MDGNHDAIREQLTHPRAVMGLSDGGAHCGLICDASMPTTMISHWTRDRHRGERLPLEWVVRKQTRDTAALFGLNDRGVVAPGKRADLNVIDHGAIKLRTPASYTTCLPGAAPSAARRRLHRHRRRRGADPQPRRRHGRPARPGGAGPPPA